MDRTTRRRGMVLAVAAAACLIVLGASWYLLRGPTSRPPEPPESPEELAIRLFGEARGESQDPGVISTEMSEDGRFTVSARVLLVTTESKQQCFERVRDFFAGVFDFNQTASVRMEITFVYRDKAGKLYFEPGLTAAMDRETHAGLNWEELSVEDFSRACDEWWLAPLFGG